MKYVTIDEVKAQFSKRFSSLSDEERRRFKQRFIFHDYEIFPEDTLLVTLDVATGKHWETWGINQIRDHLRQVFVHEESAVFVGFNNKHFDNKISDAILAGISQPALKALSDQLIEEIDPDVPWKSGDKGRFRPEWVGHTFDIGFDIGQRKIGDPPNERKIPEIGLKRWERLNGYHIMRSSVPFDKRGLTSADRREVTAYCLYDVCATAALFLSDEAWDPCVNARRVLVDDYGHKGVNWEMTKPRITAIVLNAKKENYEVPLDWENQKFVLPPEIRIWKNRDVLEAFTTKTFGQLRAMSSRKGGGTGVLTKKLCGIPHIYGVGGVHGCPKGIFSYVGGNIWALDAASLYPNLMRYYGYLSRCVVGADRIKFGELIDLRTKVYKPRGDKKADGLKLVLNGGFGSQGFEASDMYDPVNFCSITILGQLMITDLLEKAERHIEVIQSNTDGVFFRLKDTSVEGLERMKKIVQAFEARTHLEMEWTEFERMYQRDVSNYVARVAPKPGKPAGSGKLKKKGTWFGLKHCTMTPYLYESRVFSALNDGATLPVEGIEMERFATELKRDKNSRAFSVDNKPDDREWLDVVPVRLDSPKRQRIEVLLKPDETMTDTLFGDVSDDLGFAKRRKATNCPQFAALVEKITKEDIDLSWYANVKKAPDANKEDDSDTLFD